MLANPFTGNSSTGYAPRGGGGSYVTSYIYPDSATTGTTATTTATATNLSARSAATDKSRSFDNTTNAAAG